MTNTIKLNSGETALFLSIIASKAVSRDKWYVRQLSNLELAKAILNSGKGEETSGKSRLRKFIQLKNIQLQFIKGLSRPKIWQVGAVFALSRIDLFCFRK